MTAKVSLGQALQKPEIFGLRHGREAESVPCSSEHSTMKVLSSGPKP